MSKKNIHIVGTGTIGLPLTGLFARHKEKFNIGEVTFHKNTPLVNDLPNVRQLLKAGANAKAKDKEGKTASDHAKNNEDIYKTEIYQKLNDLQQEQHLS